MKPIAVVVAILGWTLVIFVSVTDTAYAQATTRFVSTTGVDVGDCSVAPCATIQFATDVATAWRHRPRRSRHLRRERR